MASLIPGYQYDIFVSYRQKDNKYDGWVTEFVENLKKELEATFKEEISLYFDINPRDGLLDTHDVDASLMEKLKCLVFIPVISRTYCDPKSFAWKNELNPFIELSSNDNLGLKILLKNGNVASRILPVRIHDLETNDLKVCEATLEGVLRSVDFIYRSAGVNRPLRSNEDHPYDNLNKIYYRDQINKVANAVHEIISSLKSAHEQRLNSTFPSAEVLVHPYNDYNSQHSDSETAARSLVRHPAGVRKKSVVRNLLFPVYGSKNIQKYALSVIILASMIFLTLFWKGELKLPWRTNSGRDKARIHVENALQYFNDGFYGPAKTELDLALKDDPEYSYAWSSLAAISVKLGNLNDAVMQTVEAVKFDPTNALAAYNLAYALEDKMDFHQAMEWYSKAIYTDSSLVPAYSALGRLYNRLNQPVDAILILSQAKDKHPDTEYMYLIYKNMGNSYLLMDNYEEAIKWLKSSLNIRPDEAETNLFMAEALEASGNVTGSIDAWQNYIRLESDTTKTAEAKKHLKNLTIKHLMEIIK